MNTNTHLWAYLSQYFLELEMIPIKTVEKIKINIIYPIACF